MSCVRCHKDLADEASYCPHCGARQHAATESAWASRRLVRVTSQEKIAGVCAGIADYLDVDVTLVRAVWLALSIVPGAIVGGVLAYILAWMVMPEGQATRLALNRRLVRSATDAKLAGVCGGIADYLGVDSTPVRVMWIVLSVLPGAIFGGVLAYLAAWLIIPKAPQALMTPHETHAA
jgi:phage shock protein PspC (stress-responsive transcriptional regulator)